LGQMLPEQVWDEPNRPGAHLILGGPAGSAVPLVWAHAEYLKLLRSAADDRVFDRVEPVYQRYAAAADRTRERTPIEFASLRRLVHKLPKGHTLRLIDDAPFDVVWSADGWKTSHTTSSHPLGSAGFSADMDAAGYGEAGGLSWTFHWTSQERWLGYNVDVQIE
jgi:glucoamylase